MISQASFGFMAAPMYGQWICHSPNVMKTDIFVGTEGRRVVNRLGGVSDLIQRHDSASMISNVLGSTRSIISNFSASRGFKEAKEIRVAPVHSLSRF